MLIDVTVFRNLIRFPKPLASWQEWYFKEKGESHISKGGTFQRVAWDSPPAHDNAKDLMCKYDPCHDKQQDDMHK